jgi:hypothetical protein
MDSILNTIKTMFGISNETTSFDTELITDINFSILTLRQLGVGPVEGFSITNSADVWDDFLGENAANLESVKSYIFNKVRLVFSAPNSSTTMLSILNTIKKMLGVQLDDDAFDVDIIVSINSVLMSLSQLGVGSASGFSITGTSETWDQFLGDAVNVEAVKSYIYLKVRLLFDPPTVSTLIDAMNRQITEFEFRLNIQVEPVTIPEVIEEEYDEEWE